MAKVNAFRELRVYQELRRLHLVVHAQSMRFPKFEMYELGSQIRRSSKAAPAILTEGWGSRHTNIYLEAISRSKGEVRETQHHLDMAHAKGYLTEELWQELDAAYETCDKMLERLYQRLSEWRGSTRTVSVVKESPAVYETMNTCQDWDSVARISLDVMSEVLPISDESKNLNLGNTPSSLLPQPPTPNPPYSSLNPQPSTFNLQPFPPPPLRLLFWELTARCNLRCRHCRAEAGETRAAGELTDDEIIRIAAATREAHDPILVLTGGEPLMRPDVFRIARACADIFSRVALASNGVLIDHAMTGDIANAGIKRVSVSLDGATATTHDAFRGQPGSFEAALRGIECLREAEIPVQINATMTRHNVDELDAMLALTEKTGADAFHLFMLVPVGCGATLGPDMRLEPERFEDALRRLHARATEWNGRLHVKATCAPQYQRIARERARMSRTMVRSAPPNGHTVADAHGMNASGKGCMAGSGVCFISRIGEVQPCGYLPLTAGTVRETPLNDIWRDSDLFASLRDPSRLRGKCGVCAYRRSCQGCRARAFAEDGDYLGAEPECPYEPGGGKRNQTAKAGFARKTEVGSQRSEVVVPS